MATYIIRRILQLFPTLVGISFLVFIVIHLTPGDPARLMLGERATEESLEKLRDELGLDRPVIVQYVTYFADLLTGDLGRSLKTHEPISKELLNKFNENKKAKIVVRGQVFPGTTIQVGTLKKEINKTISNCTFRAKGDQVIVQSNN